MKTYAGWKSAAYWALIPGFATALIAITINAYFLGFPSKHGLFADIVWDGFLIGSSLPLVILIAPVTIAVAKIVPAWRGIPSSHLVQRTAIWVIALSLIALYGTYYNHAHPV